MMTEFHWVQGLSVSARGGFEEVTATIQVPGGQGPFNLNSGIAYCVLANYFERGDSCAAVASVAEIVPVSPPGEPDAPPQPVDQPGLNFNGVKEITFKGTAISADAFWWLIIDASF